MLKSYNHYKEREPEETVKIIEIFFKEKGFIIKENIEEEESGTWSNKITLFFKDIYILSSNGKGITKDYARASGYAELYERFCNNFYGLDNPFICNKIIENNINQNKNFYLYPDEQLITWEEAISPMVIKNFISSVGDLNKTKQYFDLIFDNKYIGKKFVGINNNEEIYLDLRLLHRCFTSSGMAAGNTLEEALNQGLSEIMEHYAISEFFKKEMDNYYCIDLNTITNKNIKKIIDKMESLNYELYLFDLSYNFKVPVIMLLVIDKNNHNIFPQFGSFPILEIAIERVFTELYQNCKTLENKKTSENLIPSKNNYYEDIFYLYKTCLSDCNFLYEDIFDKIIYINFKKENDFYLKGLSYSNEEILEFIKNIFNNLNSKIYYTDMSLNKDIKAVNIYADNLHILSTLAFSNLIKYNKNSDIIINNLIELYSKLKQILITKEIKDKETNQLMAIIQNLYIFVNNKNEELLIGFLLGSDFFSLYPNRQNKIYDFKLIMEILNRNINDILNDTSFLIRNKDTSYFLYLKSYYCFFNYLKVKYDLNEINKYFKKIGLLFFLNEDYNKGINKFYLIKKVFFDNFINFYYSFELTELIKKIFL